ncbi:tetratricopeptide repeat protein [Coleofasciculus sp. FACHB-712]|uniref:tetratricopeptide repeat protein n=1 Tax=Coleofasciculus sp. FACHB-712 TaxID=2692789 RepID=UPI001689B55E|nr:tetratricopeptide repeat protein [Coleofasciculus sp. FACHB-712]MBD1941231.1 tetratricopeptide repeat protein [Coleofasciculus sp. FACHB-712]
MQTLHLDLKRTVDNYVELRYFFDNPNDYQRRSLPLSEIADLIQGAEQDYYVRLAVDYAITGRKLYNWLDGSDRFLQRLLDRYRGEGIVLAIAATEKLAYLPWEVLHDGNSFLVERLPAVVPVRWVSSDAVKKLSVEVEPENRALQVLFMATSPLGVEPVLDFEAEEGRILEATARYQIDLKVEESGCLSELGYLADYYGKGYFDVLHLTGHANLTDGQPRFVTETETGEAYLASATDIAKELQFRLPKLVFLSGCRTGQGGKSGAVPSMAEELLKSGAKAVLGWGQKVLDTESTAAAAALYQQLSAGKKLTEAVACTYQALIKNKARDWHLLRLYASGTLPGELVTPLKTPRRKPAPPPTVTTQFLDPAEKIKVATRESFVGRRRQLQNCLRALTQSPDEVGVLIHGMGGLGKSTLAARLCDRLPNLARVVWVGRIDEPSLVSRLAEKLDDKELRKALQDPDEELKFRLRRVFGQDSLDFLLVLDDFEVNLEPRDGGYVLQPEAATVLQALVWAIRETYASHRLILTCRYDFDSTQLQYFYKQPLEALRGADLQKKCSRLTAFSSESQVDEALKLQAQRLADGNPRLLEWLDKILQAPHPLTPSPQAGRGKNESVDAVAILNRLEADPMELREQVLAAALLEQMDEPMREMLSRGLVFELPVPREGIATVCESLPNLEQHINRAVALGLLEVSPDSSLRVPRILPLKLPEDAEALHKQAAEVLYRLWRDEAETSTEGQLREIHRLAFSGKEAQIASKMAAFLTGHWINQSRFREAQDLCKSTLALDEDYRILHRLARSEQELGEINLAREHYQQALDSCPENDEPEKADIIHNLGNIYANTGEVEQAIAYYQQSLEIKERIGNLQGKAATLHQLAGIYANTGEVEQAIAYYQQSLEIKERIDDVQGKAATLHCLAIIYANTGEVEQAIAYYQQSLEIEERIGDVQGKAATLAMLGQLLALQGDFNTSLNYLQQSLEILQRLKSPDAETVRQAIARVQKLTNALRNFKLVNLDLHRAIAILCDYAKRKINGYR